MPREENFFCVYVVDPAGKGKLKTFDSDLGTPADAQAWNDHGVVAVGQQTDRGTDSVLINGESRYICLASNGKWSGATLKEIEGILSGVIWKRIMCE